MTAAVRPLLSDATARLAQAGVASPRVDAELLLADLLGVSRAALFACKTVPDSVAESYEDRLARRITREPLQHIVGTAPFRHLTLAVGPGVFVPRPETELLVDAVLSHLTAAEQPLVVDLCAGSGALGLAIAAEAPGSRVIAVEANPQALSWLTRNASGTDVRIVEADVRDPDLLADLRGRVAAVVSNPPYVPVGNAVEPEVHADPRDAVFAGADGLALMPAVVARAAELLARGGVLAVEHDDTHGDNVPELFAADGRFADVQDHADLAGSPRYVTATRQ